MRETSKSGDSFGAGLVVSPPLKEEATVIGVYTAECYDKDGNLKWTETFDNVVTDVGKADMLDKYFGATGTGGGTSSGLNYMGLKGTGAVAGTNTMTSHAAWLEVGLANAPAYSGNRPSPTWSAASGATTVNKATSATSFTFTSGGTVAGAFINVNGSATKDTTTGILYSAGDFSSSRTVVSTDVLNVTYTATLS